MLEKQRDKMLKSELREDNRVLAEFLASVFLAGVLTGSDGNWRKMQSDEEREKFVEVAKKYLVTDPGDPKTCPRCDGTGEVIA